MSITPGMIKELRDRTGVGQTRTMAKTPGPRRYRDPRYRGPDAGGRLLASVWSGPVGCPEAR